ncbi:hypothetical protein BaRGS_00013673 [Batillaria attramentaria]|uniref:Uncharacterized protein n=1 Tax=Batillaria attramentaria TaxID=370345 RepID=A0ABD0L6Y0_9CAEN
MTGATTYQLIRLTKTFFSWPVKTSVNLAFSPLQLPAITICNTNPIRQSRINTLHCDLQSVLRVDDKYKSPECRERKYEMEKNLTALCSQFYWFCTGKDTEDVDEFSARKKQIQLEIAKENRKTMEEAGHQIADMVLGCSMEGVLCSSRNFVLDWNMEYGNCYTLNTTTFTIFDSGPPSGLDVIMNLEIEESLQSFKTGYGMRVVVHEPGTRPFPSSEGMTISAAVETHFGLRLEEITRLGGLYGDCRNDISEFDTGSYLKYSIKSVLEREVCSRLNNATDTERCIEEKKNRSLEERETSFLRLRVYFETLNFEQIMQEPFYDAERFLSDIGGTLGLWIGASLLGLGELVEIFCFSVLAVFRRVKGHGFFLWSRSSPQDTGNNNHTHGSIGGSTLNGSGKISTTDLFEITA